ncbi:MAG: hypothetical protein DMG13_22630 [Acidobacteria bacterium]|nr:MAG: hypothetical protein DMG13_22630 [Acidobacteriota bacterium]
MKVTFDIPDEIAAQIRAYGQDISRTALEALALDGHRRRMLTQFQVGQLLGLSRTEAEDFLAQHVDLYDYDSAELHRSKMHTY